MKYELMIILDPKLTDKEIEKTLGEVKDHLSEQKFKLVTEDVWGKRDFAYKIKGHSTGYYVVLLVEGEHAGTVELHKELRLTGGLMRYLLIKVPDDHTLMRYEEGPKASASPRKLQSKHAEELSKKVAKKPAKKEDVEEPEEDTKDNEKLDEQLKAIIDDTDIDL